MGIKQLDGHRLGFKFIPYACKGIKQPDVHGDWSCTTAGTTLWVDG